MIFRLALKAGANTYAALAASICWSLYAPALFFELTILPVSILTFLITVFMLLQINAETKSDRAAIIGSMMGVIAGLRPPFILLMGIPVWSWLKNKAWKKLTIGILLLTIPLLFLSFQQNRLGGGFYPFPRTAGCNLVLGHSSESTGYGPPIPSHGLVETGSGDIHEVAMERAAEMGITDPREADRYWMSIALSWIADHPLEELRLIAVKLGGFFGSRPFDTYYELGRITSFNPVLKFIFIPRLLISLLFLAAVIPFCLRGRNRTVILAPVIIALLSSLIFIHSERYLLPALPAMMAAAASGMVILIRMIRRDPLKWLAAATGGLLLLIPSIFFPAPSIPEEMYIGSLGVRAYLMENFDLSLELFERAALLADEGSVIWIQGHSESARIAEALGYSQRAEQHITILTNWEQQNRGQR